MLLNPIPLRYPVQQGRAVGQLRKRRIEADLKSKHIHSFGRTNSCKLWERVNLKVTAQTNLTTQEEPAPRIRSRQPRPRTTPFWSSTSANIRVSPASTTSPG